MNSVVQKPTIGHAFDTSSTHKARTRLTTIGIFNNYIEAFQRCYPGVPVEIKQAGGKYKVIIRGEWTREDEPLTLEQLQQATLDFNKGRPTIQ